MHSQYDPKKTEEKWYKFWEESGFFNAERSTSKKPFCIVIPPPNITGILHMGHALNNTLQDVLIRYKRMQGYSSLWMPGTDHAGIATQNVVERSLAKEGLKKEDLGREKFLERLWDWTDKYGSTIINQLKKLGASCDWRRIRFTLDKGYSQAVKEVFVRLYKKGLIYRGNYIINWCPRCKTALADEEAPYKEIDGWLYYIKYPIKPLVTYHLPLTTYHSPLTTHQSPITKYIVVATTRPETMLGDTAVALNPKDDRFNFLKDYKVILPIIGRTLKVIKDDIVEPSFGTGIVKVTPAHDKNDFLMAKKHNLEFINIMNDDATLNKEAKDFQGMDRFEARKAVLEVLEKEGLLEKKEPYKINAGHCYRCNTIIEPRLSWQWFVKMKPLAKTAIKVVKEGKIKFFPEKWKKVYLNWMENIEDWCISRQIWWGHRLPVYYCNNCKLQIANCKLQESDKRLAISDKQNGIIVSKTKPEKCPHCGSTNIYQDEDVLDTWFSSWLWPFATFGWPPQTQSAKRRAQSEDDLDYFYPTDVLVTASEILFFWVARMIMAGMEFLGKIPFNNVLIHGTVRDIKGIKMSKSLGNIIDPIEIIDKFGADALRFSLMLLASSGQDVYLSEEKFLVGRNFANKLWNAARYIINRLQTTDYRLQATGERIEDLKRGKLSLADKWILSQLNILIKEVTSNLEKFRINEAAKSIYEFFWHKFCDWYIEISKVEKDKDFLLVFILDKSLRILHPLMPFITEEIWQKIKVGNLKSIMLSSWPKKLDVEIGKKDIQNFTRLKELVVSLRTFKKDLGISKNIEIKVLGKDERSQKILKENLAWLNFLSRAAISVKKAPSKDYISTATLDYDIFVRKEFIEDLNTHRKKIQERIEELARLIGLQEKKLSFPSFFKKAPREVIERAEEKLATYREEERRLKRIKWL